VLLDRQMRVAFVEEQVLEHVVRAGNRRVGVTKLECLQPVDVALLGIVVNAGITARLYWLERFLRRADRVERLVAHVDQVERFGRRLLVPGDDRGERIADVAHMLGRERIFVLADRQDAEGDGEILAGEHQVHAGMRLGARHVDGLDQRVRVRRAQKLDVQHARQHDVVGKARLAGDLGAAVDAPARLADDFHGAAIRFAASSTASTIWW